MHGARKKKRVLRLIPRGSERSGAVARATPKPANSSRPQLARRITAARRSSAISCQCSALVWSVHRPEPARHGAHAELFLKLRLLSRGSESNGVVARATLKPAGSWRPQLARRTTAARERGESSRRCSALLRRMRRLQAARHGAHVQQARMQRLLPRGSERSGTVARATRKPTNIVGGRSCPSHDGRARKERRLPSEQCSFEVGRLTTSSAARRARATSPRAALHP